MRTIDICPIHTAGIVGTRCQTDIRLMGYTDVAVALVYQQVGDSKALLASVTNEGITPASGSLLFYDKNGEIVAESTFENLAGGDVAVAQYDFTEEDENIVDGDVSAVAIIDQEEYYTFNNEATLFVNKPEYYTSIRNLAVSGSNVTGRVYCEENQTEKVYSAYYDAIGRMLRVDFQPLADGQWNDVSFTAAESTKMVKWFVMDDNGVPACENVTYKVG